MRVNVEDSDLRDPKRRLERAAYYAGKHGVTCDAKTMMLGYLVFLWHGAIDSGREVFTRDEALQYMAIYDQDLGDKVLDVLEAAEYLARADGGYSLVGKEKDFEARRHMSRISGLGVEERKRRSTARSPSGNHTVTTRLPHGIPHGIPDGNHQVTHRSPPGEPDGNRQVTARLPSGQPNNNNNNNIPVINNTSEDASLITGLSESGPSPQVPRKTRKKGPPDSPDMSPYGDALAMQTKGLGGAAEQKPSQVIKSRFCALYMEAMDCGADNVPGWGAAENTAAVRVLRSYTLDKVLELLDYYFKGWSSPDLLRDGHNFVMGNPRTTFCHNIGTILSHKLDPSRPVRAIVASGLLRSQGQRQLVEIDDQVQDERVLSLLRG